VENHLNLQTYYALQAAKLALTRCNPETQAVSKYVCGARYRVTGWGMGLQESHLNRQTDKPYMLAPLQPYHPGSSNREMSASVSGCEGMAAASVLGL
jgi:hypothetical protein